MSNAPRHFVIQTAISRKHISPCKTCTERSVGCHGSCDKYAEYTKTIKTESRDAYKKYAAERMLEGASINAKKRQIQSGNRGGYAKWSAYTKGAAE